MIYRLKAINIDRTDSISSINLIECQPLNGDITFIVYNNTNVNKLKRVNNIFVL